MEDRSIRSRIAPTPSGFLHLGNVFSFVLTWLIVRKNEGYLLLRIDDLDSQRRRVEYLDDIFSTLEWLGLDYDEGASDTEDFLKNFSQELHLQEYEKLINDLLEVQPSLVFACHCSRSDVQRNSINGLYTGTCRNNKIRKADPSTWEKEVAWRVEVPSSPIVFQDELKGEINVYLRETMGDFVIRRKDRIPAYQIASLANDIKHRINYIVRGEDLIDSTAAQQFLAQVLPKNSFLEAKFLHHSLLYENQYQKMSKSYHSLSIKKIRERISTPKPIFRWIAQQLNMNTKVVSLQDLLEELDLAKIPPALYHPDFLLRY